MDHKGPLVADLLHSPGYWQNHLSAVDPANAVSGQSGIGQRAGDVQNGAESDLREDPGEGRGMDLAAHAVEYADPCHFDAPFHQVHIAVNVYPELLEHIHCAAAGGYGPRTVLGHVDIVRRRHNRGRGADVEGLDRVHARPAVISQRPLDAWADLQCVHLIYRLPDAGDLLGCRPLGGDGGQERPLLQIRLLVIQDLTE